MMPIFWQTLFPFLLLGFQPIRAEIPEITPLENIEILDLNDIILFQTHFESLAKEERWEEILILGTPALQAAKKLDRVKDEAKICAQIASTKFYQGNYQEALEYAQHCRQLSEKFTKPTLFLRALYLESASYRALASKQPNQEE